MAENYLVRPWSVRSNVCFICIEISVQYSAALKYSKIQAIYHLALSDRLTY